MGESSAKRAGIGVSLFAAVVIILLISYDYPRRRDDPDTTAAAERTVDIIYSFTVNDIPKEANRLAAWVPLPLDNEQQRLLAFEVLDGRLRRMVREPEYDNHFLVFDAGPEQLSSAVGVGVKVRFRVTRYAVTTMHKNYAVPSAPGPDLARYLAPDRLVPIAGRIAEEARAAAGHLQDPLLQSRLLYDHIVSTLTYDKSGSGWGRGDALYACDVRRGNCSDFHSLFIAEARALGIPARFVMGLPLPENRSKGDIPGYHCWGEFYLHQTGWVPVDASEASKNPDKKESFFGALDQHRVGFSLGRDIKLPGSAAQAINYAIYPHVEIDGQVHENVQATFSFESCSNENL